MADVNLDTPTAAYGIPTALMMFDAAPNAAYARLAPAAQHASAWWEQHPVADIELPAGGPVATAKASGNWDIPPELMVVDTSSVRGVITAQAGVNAEHIETLLAAMPSQSQAPLPWGPLWALTIGEALWLMDGTHRAAAATRAGRAAHPAHLVDLDDVTSCPCGWQGEPGAWLAHECPEDVRAAHRLSGLGL